MTPQDFKDWRGLMGWTQAQAAAALDVGRDMVASWEIGRAPIRLRTALACSALYHRQKPWPHP